MRSLLLFCVLLTALTFRSAFATEPERPMSEMKGGCGDYKMALTQEFKDWALGAAALSTHEGKKGTLLPLNRRLKLLLEPVAQVKFARPPEKGGQEGYGAVVPLRVANTGIYRVALGERAWIDMSGKDGGTIAAERFEMQTGCDKIRKVVTYKLDGGKDYLLQIAGARGSSADMMFSKQP